MLEFFVLFLSDLCSETISVLFNVSQADFDCLNGLLVKRQAGQNYTFVDVGGSDWFIGVFIIFIQKSFLYLQGNFQCF